MDVQNSLSSFESRLDSLEIDIARLAGSREDDTRRAAGEMAVMKARVEDALRAFSATSEELRDTVRTLEKRFASESLAPDTRDVRADSALGARIDELGAQMDEIQTGILKIAEHVGALTPLSKRLAKLERTVAKLVDQNV